MYLNILVNYLSNIMCNFVKSLAYHDNPIQNKEKFE